MIRLAAETPLILDILDNCSGAARKDFPEVLTIFKSGSKSLLNERLKSLRPVKTESTTNSAKAPTTIPTEAMPLMILIALFLLALLRYRLAM